MKKNLGIAYSMERKNKMAKGGAVKDDSKAPDPKMPAPKPDDDTATDKGLASIRKAFGAYAMGGEVKDHYESIADAILEKKRSAKMMADGGMVDLDENAEESPNVADELNEDALLKENYSEDSALEDLTSSIRKKKSRG